MRWVLSDLLSASAFGVAYTCVYYLTNKLGYSSLTCGSLVKIAGALLISCMLLFKLFVEKRPIGKEIASVARSPFVLGVIFACSLLWFGAEVLLYETQSIAPQPAYATAVWNLAPLPVFLLSLHFSKSPILFEQYLGIGCILVAVYLINI